MCLMMHLAICTHLFKMLDLPMVQKTRFWKRRGTKSQPRCQETSSTTAACQRKKQEAASPGKGKLFVTREQIAALGLGKLCPVRCRAPSSHILTCFLLIVRESRALAPPRTRLNVIKNGAASVYHTERAIQMGKIALSRRALSSLIGLSDKLEQSLSVFRIDRVARVCKLNALFM